eukprot:Opistho-1_new@34091
MFIGRPWLQVLADHLRNDNDVGSYILDPRGCGLSGGKRGDAKSPEHLWADIRTVVHAVRTRHPGIPVVLIAWGRHGGLLLNYVTWKEAAHVDGLVFLATGMAHNINTVRTDALSRMRDKFKSFDVTVSRMTGGMFRSHGETWRMSKGYTELIKATLDPLFVSFGSATYIMAHQVEQPLDVIKNLDIPFCYVVGEKDEFVIVDRIKGILETNDQVHATRRKFKILPKVRHLELLVKAHTEVGPFIDSIANTFSVSHNLPTLNNPTIADFEKLKLIGRGAFAEVSLVRHKESGHFLALKTMLKRRVVEMDNVAHVLEEKEVLKTLNYPFVVSMAGAFQDERSLYLVLEFVIGGELFTVLKMSHRFPEAMARFYVAEVSLALGYLHSMDIVYRDLKPENVLLDSRGHVKLTDYGFARRLPRDGLCYSFVGTPEYLAPEIIEGAGHGKASDWWTLGVFTFELIAGRVPFKSSNRSVLYEMILEGQPKFPARVSPALTDFIKRLMTRSPARRLGGSAADTHNPTHSPRVSNASPVMSGSGPSTASLAHDASGGTLSLSVGRRMAALSGQREIAAHAWMADIDWKLMEQGHATPPFVPSVSGEGDTGNFIEYDEDAHADSEGEASLASAATSFENLFAAF